MACRDVRVQLRDFAHWSVKSFPRSEDVDIPLWQCPQQMYNECKYQIVINTIWIYNVHDITCLPPPTHTTLHSFFHWRAWNLINLDVCCSLPHDHRTLVPDLVTSQTERPVARRRRHSVAAWCVAARPYPARHATRAPPCVSLPSTVEGRVVWLLSACRVRPNQRAPPIQWTVSASLKKYF